MTRRWSYTGNRVSRDGEAQSRWGRGDSGRPTTTWRPLKPTRRRRGYLYVNLHRDGIKAARSIHHLVLEAFVGPRPPGLICCHDDGDPANNRVENLRWDTYLSNSEDMLRHGTRLMGSSARAKLSEEHVLEIRRLKGEGVPMRKVAVEFGVCLQNINVPGVGSKIPRLPGENFQDVGIGSACCECPRTPWSS